MAPLESVKCLQEILPARSSVAAHLHGCVFFITQESAMLLWPLDVVVATGGESVLVRLVSLLYLIISAALQTILLQFLYCY